MTSMFEATLPPKKKKVVWDFNLSEIFEVH